MAGALGGTVLCGRYRLEQLIGAGGMAQVWRGTDDVLGRHVAVKLLHPHLAGDDAFVRRFRQEAVAAARLSHPGIVGVYDTCSDGGHEAIVMELLDATTLRQHLDETGPLDADTTVRIALRLLEALEAAHRAGLVHRDVKPSNVLLCRDGRVKIADFGIAKADDRTELTQEGTLVGTASYLAPEQLLGGVVDARTDLYSVGIVLYECLTGRTPFDGDTGAAVALARLHSDPPDPRRVRSDVPAGLALTVNRALRREPDERFDSAAELRAALLEDGVPPPIAPSPVRVPTTVEFEPEPESFTRSERRWLFPALFILLIAVALVVAALLVRESTGSGAGSGSAGRDRADATASGPITAIGLRDPIPHDPQGRGAPGENDRLAPFAIDGDPSTSWRTESYDNATFFGDKTGVGLGLVLEGPAEVTGLRLDGSTNGWSASVYVLDDEEFAPLGLGATGGLVPDDLEPAAEILGARAPVVVEVAPPAVGSIVLVWITDLGELADNGRHRVEVTDVSIEGRPVQGA